MLKQEETTFLKTLVTGEEKLAALLAGGTKTLAGADVFHLHETYGFPLELTREIAAARGDRRCTPGVDKREVPFRVGSGDFGKTAQDVAPVESRTLHGNRDSFF